MGNLGSLNYCIEFQGCQLSRTSAADRLRKGENRDECPNVRGKATAAINSDNCMQHAVFVRVGQVSEKCELMDVGAMPGIWPAILPIIRLKALDECSMVSPNHPEVAITLPLRLTTEPSLIILKVCGSNSVVRVPAFQAGCRGFESHLPLHFLNYEKRCSQSGVARLGERTAKSPYRQRTEKYCRHCWARDGKDSDVAGQSASIDLPQRTQSAETSRGIGIPT